MDLREIVADDFHQFEWDDLGYGAWRIVADLTCRACGAYQAADSDPTPDKGNATRLCVRLFNSIGWRANERQQIVCPDCANKVR